MRTAPHLLPPWQEARRLAIPATFSLLLHAAYRVNDQYWVRELGPDAQAALGLTSFLHILNFGFATLLATGTLARMAHASGSGDREGVRRAWHASWAFGLPWFALIGAFGWLTTPLWVQACGAQGEAARMAVQYLGVIYLVQPAIAMKPVVDAAYFGLGNTLIPMLLAALAVLLNFVTAPLLIYGFGNWEGMGIAGAAWSTGFSRLVAVALGMFLLARWFGLPLERRRADRAELRRMLAIGAPLAASAIVYALVFILLLKTSVQELGRDVQAGLGVGFNGVEAMSYCALMGPAVAAASIVGRRLGAGDRAGARAGMRACLWMSAGIAAVTTVVFWIAPGPLVGIFAREEGVRHEAAIYLRIVALSQVVTAVDAVLQQSMAGAGRTLQMSLINLAGYMVRIPLAALLTAGLGWGAAGVWWAMNLSNYLKLGAMILLFRRLRLFAGFPTPGHQAHGPQAHGPPPSRLVEPPSVH